MPEISAFLVNETLHQGLVFICVPPALPSPSLYKSKQLAGLLTKPNRYRARRYRAPLCPRVLPDSRGEFPLPRELPGQPFSSPAPRPRHALGTCLLKPAEANAAAAARLGSAQSVKGSSASF